MHEKLIHSLDVVDLKGDLLHYSYYSISDHIKRIDTYTELGAQMVLKKGGCFLLLQAVLRAKFKFFRMYILKLGFLDGFYGFVLAVIGAQVVFIKYVKAASYKRRKS